MRRRLPLIVVVIVVGSILLGVQFVISNLQKNSEENRIEFTRLDRILSSAEIRASYLIYPPYFMRDPNSGELSGIFYDVMEEIAALSEINILWVEEVGYEGIFAGLDANRYDVFAGGLWPSTSRAKAGGFSIPVFYSVITAWGRPDESRFQSTKDFNSPNVRIATIDGAMEDIIAQADFPKAKRESLPQLSPFTQNLLNITSNKADLTFAEPGIIQEFLKSNPNTLKELINGYPLRIFGNSIVVPRSDLQLRNYLNAALRELLFSGRVDKILEKY